MPKKTKKTKILAKQFSRQMSTPTKSVNSKKSKVNSFPHHPNSASDIFRMGADDVVRDPSPPTGRSRSTSPINIILPLLEYGFSWPRRKSPFAKSSSNKTVTSPVDLVSLDSGCPSSPSNESDVFSPTPMENGSCLPFDILSPNGSSPSSDMENAQPDIDAVIASLDDVIDEVDSDDDNGSDKDSGSDNDFSVKKMDDSEVVMVTNDPLDDDETKDMLNELPPINGIIKEGKGSNSKRVRFSIEHPALRKARSLEFIKNHVVKEPCSWNIVVRMVDIQPGDGDTAGTMVTELESFLITVSWDRGHR